MVAVGYVSWTYPAVSFLWYNVVAVVTYPKTSWNGRLAPLNGNKLKGVVRSKALSGDALRGRLKTRESDTRGRWIVPRNREYNTVRLCHDRAHNYEFGPMASSNSPSNHCAKNS